MGYRFVLYRDSLSFPIGKVKTRFRLILFCDRIQIRGNEIRRLGKAYISASEEARMNRPASKAILVLAVIWIALSAITASVNASEAASMAARTAEAAAAPNT